MKLTFLIKISRPRFWIYLLGPFLIGVAGAYPGISVTMALVFTALYFTFPANFLVYAVNDLFDYETDKNNLKKKGYEVLLSPEGRTPVYAVLSCVAILTTVLALVVNWYAWFGLIGFLFFGIFYSATPIRAKTKPIIDTMFNVLYVFPAIVSYGLITGQFPPFQLVFAGMLWCMAMHAFSAVPDISADKKADLETVATLLGEKYTLLFCLVCYLLSALLSFRWIGGFSLLALLLYGGMMIVTLNAKDIFAVYKRFPLINMITGLALFFWIIFIVK